MNRSYNSRFHNGESVMQHEANFLWANTPPDKRRNIRQIVKEVAQEMGLSFSVPLTDHTAREGQQGDK